MRLIVLGATGMLGHKLSQFLSKKFDVYATVRSHPRVYNDHPVLSECQLLGNVSAENFDSVMHAFSKVHPDVAINCIGIVKQRPEAKDLMQSILVNAFFPHRLARLCQAASVRLVHISTDCVFSGKKGNYVESDVADAYDLYGRTKFLGEVSSDGCLTLRTSIVGRELETSHGLLEWFLSQEGKTILGYKRSIFSGFTTNILANIIDQIITKYRDMQGVWHVASEPISKFELLSLVKKVYGLKIKIDPDETVVCDRSLNAERFQRVTGFVPPPWPDMIMQMYRDATPYSEFRPPNANG